MNVSNPQSVPAMTLSGRRRSREPREPPRDDPRVLHVVGLRVDRPEDDPLAVRQRDVLEDLPLVLVARVGGLEVDRADVRLQDVGRDVVQRMSQWCGPA